MEDYVHPIGRTDRAAAKGTTYTTSTILEEAGQFISPGLAEMGRSTATILEEAGQFILPFIYLLKQQRLHNEAARLQIKWYQSIDLRCFCFKIKL